MTEHQLYELIAQYLQVKYKDVIYRFDLAADLKLTMGQAAKHKRLQKYRGYPDLFIAEAKKNYAGLYLEIKKEGTRVFKKDGTPATDHIREQKEMLDKLNDKGYYATFAVGFEEAKRIIDEYLC